MDMHLLSLYEMRYFCCRTGIRSLVSTSVLDLHNDFFCVCLGETVSTPDIHLLIQTGKHKGERDN